MVTQHIEIVQDNRYYAENRLPVDLAPENYQLNLLPDLEKFTFKGSVNIDFVVSRTIVSEVILNAVDLEIRDAYVIDVENVRINAKKVIYNSENETISIRFDKDEFNPRSMRLDFDGTINEKLKGFYRTRIRIGDEDFYGAATQLCPTDARRIFPCFDEPISKSSFEITITYDKKSIQVGDISHEMVCLSNTDLIAEESLANGKTMAKFDVTPNMSTYLVAFVIGPFEYVEAISNSKNKTRVRVYTTSGKKEQGQFALDVARRALTFYEDYFNVDYPLAKLDLIAIPDCTFGAMENWGLITYRETTLLYDSKTTSTAAKQYIAIVVAHEIAHQWFGNLVTMAWWNDIWLNEGFASFMQYLCVDTIYPEWDLWSQFVSDIWRVATAKDSLQSSHPINIPVEKGSEIMQIFDEISYKKGCSLIRMIHEYIGDGKFRVGMNDYLETYSYENTTTDNLWHCLEKASQKPITEMMSTWTNRMGYPWIKVNIVPNESKFTAILHQKRFTANGKLVEQDESLKWMIPVTIQSGSPDVKPLSILMQDGRENLVIEGQGDHWLKLNNDTIGFYRIEYPPELVEKLLGVIKEDFRKKDSDPNSKDTLSSRDRLGIQDDYFALCQAGQVETSTLLKLLLCFEEETNYVVWNSIDNCISRLSIIFRDDPCNLTFKAFGRRLYGKIYSKLTWQPRENETHTNAILRSLVINRLVAFEEISVIKHAIELFQSHTKNESEIPADLRGAVYTSISIAGSDQEFDLLFEMRRDATAQDERNRLASALGSANRPDRLKRAIDLILSDEVRNQDKIGALEPIAGSDPALCWNLFKERLDYFREIYGNGIMMSRLIKCSTQYFATKFRANEVEKFFEVEKFPGSEMSINQSLENIRLNANWCLRLVEDVEVMQFLNQFKREL